MCNKIQSRYMSRKAPFLQATNFPNFGKFEYNHESRNHESQFWYYACNFGSVSVPAKMSMAIGFGVLFVEFEIFMNLQNCGQ